MLTTILYNDVFENMAIHSNSAVDRLTGDIIISNRSNYNLNLD